MNKKILYIITATLLSVFIILSAHSQEDMVVVDNSAFVNPERSPSVFKHDEHNEMAEIEDCSECHHVYINGEMQEDETSEDLLCSDCHKSKDSGRVKSLMNAFHANCKGCHLESKGGPITCGECHK